MDAALKRMVITDLRPAGFRGSFPHLRRAAPGAVHLISFQYHSAGGSFVVEIASSSPSGFTTGWGTHIRPEKVRAQDIPPPDRPRLGSPTFPVGDHWFDFGPRSYEVAPTDRPASHYDALARQVARLVAEQAEPYWRMATS
jgi:hypothetical protein